MGVRGLQFYMEKKCPDAFVSVYIPDLIPVGIQQPVILIDGSGLMFWLYKKSNLDWLTGGQFIQFSKHIEDFVNQFLKHGIKPIILFDGDAPPEKRDTIVNRTLEKLKRTLELFDKVNKSDFTELEKYFKPPGTLAIFIRLFKLIAGCEVKTTLNEADREIAQLARDDESCIGIIAQDTDFVIFDTKPYLSLNHLDINGMKTKIYDRRKFCRQIGLDMYNLPLLSCMMGNDVVLYEWLREFHQQLRFGNITEKASSFINRLKTIRYTDAFQLDIKTLSPLTQIMFNNDPVKRNRLLAGIRSYMLETGNYDMAIQNEIKSHEKINNASVRNLLKTAMNKHLNSEISSDIYIMMLYGTYNSGAKREDRRTGLPSSAILYQPIRRRHYKILKNSETLGCLTEDSDSVKEWCVYEGCQMDSPDVIEPSEDIDDDVRLQELWFEADKQLKWTTLLDIWNATDMMRRLETCAEWEKIFLIIMQFLVDNCEINSYEIDAFVAQCVSPIAKNVHKLEKLKVQKVYARSVHLATLFLMGYRTMMESLSLCGNPIDSLQSDIRKFFDGNVFNYCYNLASEKTSTPEAICCNEDSATTQFHKMKAILDI